MIGMAVALATVAALVFVSTPGTGASTASLVSRHGAAGKVVIGLSVKTLTDDPFQAAWVAAAKKELAKLGASADLLVAGGEQNSEQQVSQIQDMITAHVNGMIVDPIDTSAVIPVLRRAKAAHIPVILVDVGIASSYRNLYQTYISTDQVGACKELGTYLADLLGPTGKVALMEGGGDNIVGIERDQGFTEGLATKGIKPVSEVAGDMDDSTAFSEMQNVLTAQPNLNGVLIASDVMLDGVLQALADAHDTGVKVASMDGSSVGIEAIIQGKAVADQTQNPGEMGTLGAEDIVGIATGAIKSGSLPAFINSGTVTVTKADAKAALKTAFS
jgi:ABC-type sugar transport system substrate-binding protein